MTFSNNHPGYRIATTEQARNWVVELTTGVEDARTACDVQTTPDATRKAYSVWQVRHGSALGALKALHRVGLLNDVAYNELRTRILATANPTLIMVPK